MIFENYLPLLLIIVVVARLIYTARDNNGQALSAGQVFVVSSAASSILYFAFFSISGWVWSFSSPRNPSDFTPGVRVYISEHDGIESTVLYLMMFANILISVAISGFVQKYRYSNVLYLIAITILTLIGFEYYYHIGFHPPMHNEPPRGFWFSVFIAGSGAGLCLLYRKRRRLATAITIALIAFAGLVSILPYYAQDLSYILAPALRLKYGFPVTEIYFQYDVLLSLLALLFMKLNLALKWFAYTGQLSYFFLFLSLFLFTSRFFKSGGLSVLFIFGLIIVRYYSASPSGAGFFQVTPLRLDLWVIPLLLANRKGIYHWLVGLSIGVLVVLHRNLGLIYMLGYLQLLAVLYLIDAGGLLKAKNFNRAALLSLFLSHLKWSARNLLLIAVSVGLCLLIFHEVFSAGAILYRKIGIGMLQIDRVSFYWYVPVVLSALAVLILFYRRQIGPQYSNTALFVVLLAVGNSMYFFGRSHENNILNISTILVLAVFILFDLFIYLFSQRPDSPVPHAAAAGVNTGQTSTRFYGATGRLYLILPVLFVFIACFYYSENVRGNIKIQCRSVLKRKIVKSRVAIPRGLADVKQITHGSSKVYFPGLWGDFYYYYYGNYSPPGYFNPSAAWIYRKDWLHFMQGLLDSGYYIVYDNRGYNWINEYMPYLKCNRAYQAGNMVALKKVDSPGLSVPLLLPQAAETKLHIGINGILPPIGLDTVLPPLNSEFTIQVIMKPAGSQQKGAAIINNIEEAAPGFKGFSFQCGDDTSRGYLFAWGDGTQTMRRAHFMLDSNKWNYVVITVNPRNVTVYNNGMLLTKLDAGNNPGLVSFAHSSVPATIGNSAKRQQKFSGNIREVEITDGNLDEAEIIRNTKKIAAELAD